MPQSMEFYDLKGKRRFSSSNYTTSTNAKGMVVAKTTAPSGAATVKILRKA